MRALALLVVVGLLPACSQMMVHTDLKSAANLQDRDRDGVINERDQCQDSDVRFVVDGQGCTLYRASEENFLLDINFENGSGYLHPRYYPVVRSLAQALSDNPTLNVLIEGHASTVGDNAGVNYKLSLRRARMIADLLIAKYAIASSRVSVIGRGAMAVKAEGDNSVSHRQNRRVNAVLSDKVPLEKNRWY